MATKTFRLPSVIPAVTRLVTIHRGQYAGAVEIDGRQVLTKPHGGAWAIAPGIEDAALVADAARAAWRAEKAE